MDVLSPRSTNVPPTVKQPQKKQAEAEAEVAKPKVKDHAPPPPSIVIQPPERSGDLTVQYKTGKELGKGGFAICYEGKQRGKNGGQTYALKIVKAQMAQKKMEDKFRTELQIHAKMRHPNIVEFYKAFTFKDSTYLVLELCPNGSIQDMVRARKGISLPEVRRLAVQLCGAIKYMHSRNVIHRDLKMGNLFLDYEMNVKIGDFGLAAVLVSPGECDGVYKKAFSRRTTLCGTPNYIAPEILDKGKGGHDLKVDIWALGCILYAMLCCRPPFQANSSSEIYQKAKAVDYEWPSPETTRNHIPEEAKDLVTALLKPNPEDRIGVDEVVGHPFFSMHGGDCIPLVLDPKCKEKKPTWLRSEEPRGDVMREGTKRLKLRDLAKTCGVGHLDGITSPFKVVGGDVDISMYKACVAEEVNENGPVVPVPIDTVYIGKTTHQDRISISDSAIPPVPQLPIIQPNPAARMKDASEDINPERSGPSISQRISIPSHASTLRAPHLNSTASRAHGRTAKHTLGVDKSLKQSGPSVIELESLQGSRGLMNERPVRKSRTLPRNTAIVTRSQKSGLTKEEAIPIFEDDAKRSPRMTRDEIIDQLCPNPDERRRELASRGKARIATNLQNELNALSSGSTSSRGLARSASIRSKKILPPLGRVFSLQDDIDQLPGSTGSEVLDGILNLRQEIDSALTNAASGIVKPDRRGVKTEPSTKDVPPLVTKWVDYTNKFGAGYILIDGTIGCIIKASEAYGNPQCTVVVAGTDRHYRNKNDQSTTGTSQIIPQDGYPVEISDISDTGGIVRVVIPPERFRTKKSLKKGEHGWSLTNDPSENEKRRRLSIWRAFANYMTQNMPPDNSSETKVQKSKDHIPGPFVRMYQRLGNVGVWAFSDGAFQFNFPDHTKLLLAGNGKWAEFYHLPAAAIGRIEAGEAFEDTLDQRDKVCHPLLFMLMACYKDVVGLSAIVKGNQLVKKVEFVRDVLNVWDRGGGLGCLEKEPELRWTGLSVRRSLAWVSVGKSGGDIYYKEAGSKETKAKEAKETTARQKLQAKLNE